MGIVLTNGLIRCLLVVVLLPISGWAVDAGPGAGEVENAGAAMDPIPGATGCGFLPPDETPQSVRIDDRDRQLISIIPADYDPTVTHDLVVAFHGRTNGAAQVRGYYDLERYALRPTIFVYPTGIKDGNGRYSWWNSGDRGDQLRDFALFEEIVNQFRANYCIADVYAVGHSLGASFVNSLGCARGQLLRGIVSLGGGIESVPCTGSVAAMIVHNPADRLVPLRYGVNARDRFLKAMGADVVADVVEPIWLKCEQYLDIDNDPSAAFPLLWCPHRNDLTWRGRYYPHNWPRGMGREAMHFLGRLSQQ